MRQSLDVGMSERCNPMRRRPRLCMSLSDFRVLGGLPRMLLSGQVILLPLLFSHTMGVRGAILQFGRPLVVLVM
jgi:hypothetical protein